MKPLLSISKIAKYLNDIKYIFNSETGVKTIDDFILKVNQKAKLFSTDPDIINTYKGDMLEILAEIFFRIFASDPTVGIIDYSSISLDEDFGVDGFGKNVNGDDVVAQIKFRSNPCELITYTDLSKTFTAGKLLNNFPLDKNDTIFLFTTANGVSSACQKVFNKKLRIINKFIISRFIDNNKSFWLEAEELILLSLNKT